MIVIGIDAHKRSHTAVAIDHVGQELGHKTIAATPEGHVELFRWASQWPERRWALEDGRSFTRHLEADLVRLSERATRVPPSLMATHRRPARKRGKSDPIDARAVAEAALREPDLQEIYLDDFEREVRLLSDRRDTLVNDRTRKQNQLHVLVYEIRPDIVIGKGSLSSLRKLESLAAEICDATGAAARIARELLTEIRDLTKSINSIERELKALIEPAAPNLLGVVGISIVGAAGLIGQLGNASRFGSKDAFAMHNGTAPIPVWSANPNCFRLNQGGNRRVNSIIHMASLVQSVFSDQAKAYFEQQQSRGQTKRRARRSHKRHLSNVIYRAMLKDERLRSQAPKPTKATHLAAA